MRCSKGEAARDQRAKVSWRGQGWWSRKLPRPVLFPKAAPGPAGDWRAPKVRG